MCVIVFVQMLFEDDLAVAIVQSDLDCILGLVPDVETQKV